MGNGPYVGGARGAMPGPLRVLRVLLFVYAGGTLLAAVVGLGIGSFPGDSVAENLGSATWTALPGVLALVCGLRLRKGRRKLWWGLVALQVFLILLALSMIGQGEQAGGAELLMGPVMLVLVVLRSSRTYLR